MKKITKILGLSAIIGGVITPVVLLANNSSNVKVDQWTNDVDANKDQSNIITDDDKFDSENIDSIVIDDNVQAEGDKISAVNCTAEDSGQVTNTWMGITSDFGGEINFVINKEWTSDLTPGEVAVTQPNSLNITSTKLTIPSYIMFNGKKYNVTAIDENAFKTNNHPVGRYMNLTGPLTIPASVTSIGKTAFVSCPNLTGLDLSGATSLSTIGERAFETCSGLTGTLTIPAKVTSIGGSAFISCSGLTSLDLSNATSLQTIGYSAFRWCSNLTGTLTIPASVTSIGSYAFQNCSGLTDLDLSNAGAATSLQTIGDFAFNNCSSLAPPGSFGIPASVISIGNSAFRDAFKTSRRFELDFKFEANLKSIGDFAFNGANFSNHVTAPLTIPAKVTSIGQSAFQDCSDLFALDLSGATSLSTIGESAFSGCSGLFSNLTIPASVTSIGLRAFAECSKLTGFDLSNATSLQTINGEAFINCSSLTTLNLSGATSLQTIGDLAFKNCSGLTGTLTIPKNITSIQNQTFFGCSGLTGTLTIPASITSIGFRAFAECSKLTGLDLSNATSLQTINDDAFINCPGLTSTLTIPASVTSIGSNAFQATNFDEVTFYSAASKISFGNKIFSNVDSSINTKVKLIVPKNAKSGYDSIAASKLYVDSANISEIIVISEQVVISNLDGPFTATLKKSGEVIASPIATTKPDIVDNPDKTWTLDGAPSWLDINSTTGQITTTGTGPQNVGETVTVKVKVSCNDNPTVAKAEQSISIAVEYAPISSLEIEPIAPVSVTLGDSPIANLTTCKAKVLPDGSDLSKVEWSIVNRPDWLDINSKTGVVSTNKPITTPMADSADYTIKVDSTDGTNKSATQTLKINFIKPAPTGFTITAEKDYVSTKDNIFSKQLTATPIPAYADPSVIWSLRNAPTGLTISSDGLLTSNCENAIDKTTFTIVATSIAPGATNVNSTFDSTFTVNYAAAVDIEFIDPTPAQNTIFNYVLNSGPKVLFTCNARVTPNNADPSPYYSLLNSPSNAIKIDNNTGVVSVDNIIDPEFAKGNGEKQITVRIQPLHEPLLYKSRLFTIKFIYPDPQAIIDINNAQTNYELSLGENINTKLEAVLDHDFSNPDVNWQLINQPEGMTIDPKTGLLQYTPSKVVSKTDFQIKVSAANDPAVSFTFNSSITVKYANVEKVEITPLVKSDFEITLGQDAKNLVSLMQAKVYPENLVNQDVTWSIDNKPSWLNINDKTGQIDIDKVTDVALVIDDYHNYTIRATSDQEKSISATVNLKIKFVKPGVSAGEITKINSKYKRTLISDPAAVIANPEILADHDYENTASKWSLKLKDGSPLPSWISIDVDTGAISVIQITNEADVNNYTFIVSADNNISHVILTKEFIVEIAYQTAGGVSIDAPDGTSFEVTLGTINEMKIGHFDATVNPNPGANQQVIWRVQGGLNKWLRIDDTNGDLFVKDVIDENLLVNGGIRKFTITASAINFPESSDDIEITIHVKRPAAESVNIDATSIDANYLLTTIETKQVNCKAKVNSQYADQSVIWSIESATSGLSIPDSITINPTTGQLTIKNNQAIEISLKIIAKSSTNDSIPADSFITNIKIVAPNAENVNIKNLNDEYIITQDDEIIYTIRPEAIINPIEAIQGVDWDLLKPVQGISIDKATGVITIDITQVVVYEFTVVAKCKTNETISGQKSVKVNVLEKKVLAPASVLTITVLATAVPAMIAAGSTAFVFKKKTKR